MNAHRCVVHSQHHQIQQTVPSPAKPPLPAKSRSGSGVGLPGHVGQAIVSQEQPTVVHPGMAIVGTQPVVVSSTAEILHQQQQQQPAFLQSKRAFLTN